MHTIVLGQFCVSTAGVQLGVELVLLQTAQPQPFPQVCLAVSGLAVCNHNHHPLDFTYSSSAADASAWLGHCAVHLEPQRVAQQPRREAQLDAEDFGAEGSAETSRLLG